eukprot:CAMPEP_0197197284 /NCGR_PEP_ID=MMETSP1423-20130617/32788_1 /TAXON_ID=476441 /ORGANISM="Pseudo-nitzschia heimii, Strain UNC1101" /LENGTH=135 /DNA_ID=CAMNT_0042651103 /DNA_START=395 /DNA_END=802 /DNA_ORIENTATION=-
MVEGLFRPSLNLLPTYMEEGSGIEMKTRTDPGATTSVCLRNASVRRTGRQRHHLGSRFKVTSRDEREEEEGHNGDGRGAETKRSEGRGGSDSLIRSGIEDALPSSGSDQNPGLRKRNPRDDAVVGEERFKEPGGC